MLVETVTWYVRASEAIDGVAQRWVAAAREHLPEAIPQRYGDSEPLRGRWHTGGGEEGLVEAHARADPMFALGYDGVPGPTGVRVFGAGLPIAAGARPLGDATSLTLSVAAGAAAEIEPFVLALAQGPGTILVLRDAPMRWGWTGRTLFTQEYRPIPYLAPHGRWQGLPPDPPPWCWLGPEYARAVRRYVPGTEVAGGLVPEPGVWVPEEWRMRPDALEFHDRAAPRMPDDDPPDDPPPTRRWRFFGRR